MQTIPCPGCRTDLDPSVTVCHICTRPRGKLEITRGFATLRELEKQRKQRPFIITGRILAAAVVGGLVFRFHQPLLSAAAVVQAKVSKSVNDILYPPPPPGSVPIASPNQVPPAPAPGPAAAPAATASPAAAASAAQPAAQAAPATAEKASRKRERVEDLALPAFDATAQWAFYGRAFDVITLKPVKDAQLSFNVLSANRTGTDLATTARTDDEGRFMAVLRRLPEGSTYELRAFRTGYASPVLYESDIPYATLDLGDRREMARQAQDGDMALPPLSDVAGETALRRDVFLAPSR